MCAQRCSDELDWRGASGIEVAIHCTFEGGASLARREGKCCFGAAGCGLGAGVDRGFRCGGIRHRCKGDHELGHEFTLLAAVELLFGAALPFCEVADQEAVVGSSCIVSLQLGSDIPG